MHVDPPVRGRGRAGAALWLLATGAVSVGVLTGARLGAQAPEPSRAVCLSALDAAGAPVANLAAGEVAIKEDDQVQPVVSLEPASTRMSIVILVDDAGPNLDQFRLGIAKLINRLLGAAEFSMVGLAGQNETLLELTDKNESLVTAVRGLRPRVGQPGQHVIPAVNDALGAVEKREAMRPVVIVLTNDVHESGNAPAGPVLDRLGRSGAQLFVVDLTQPLPARNSSPSGSVAAFSHDNDALDADRSRSQLLNDGPTLTGGRRIELVAPAGVPAAMDAIAQELAGQYVLVFRSHANASDRSKVAVTTTRSGVRLYAPQHSGSRPLR